MKMIEPLESLSSMVPKKVEQVPLSFLEGKTLILKHLYSSYLRLKRAIAGCLPIKKATLPPIRRESDIYKRSGFFNEKYLVTHKCRKTAITLGTILCGADTAKTHVGHSSWSAHGRYVDMRQKELNNPIPAAIARTLGFLNSPGKNVVPVPSEK